MPINLATPPLPALNCRPAQRQNRRISTAGDSFTGRPPAAGRICGVFAGLFSEQIEFDPEQIEFNSEQIEFDSEQIEFNSEQIEFNSEQNEFDSEQNEFDSEQNEFDSEQNEFDSEQNEFDSEQNEFDPEQNEFNSEQNEFDSGQMKPRSGQSAEGGPFRAEVPISSSAKRKSYPGAPGLNPKPETSTNYQKDKFETRLSEN